MDGDPVLGGTLLTLARGAIAHALGAPAPPQRPHARLDDPGATFVTIHHRDGELHGCIGSLEPRRPLAADVRANALAAAFLDPRSEPLRAEQLDDVLIEVSLLGALERIDFGGDQEVAVSRIRPHEDGLVLSWGPFRGVLLPQVWEKLPDVRVFLAHLKRKAGLPADFWAADVELRRFGLQKWHEEPEPRAPAVQSGIHTT